MTKELIRAAMKDGCRQHCDALIDELRRLEIQRGGLLEALKFYENAGSELRRLVAQRDALLEALKYHQEQTRPIQKSIDAIQAAEENT